MMSTVEKLSEAGNYPTYQEVYKKVIRDHFGHSPLDGVTDEQFVRQVVKRFRKAPVVLCSRSIGKWINRKLGETGRTQQDLAERLGVDRSAVTYWIRGGNITLDNLAQVLIEFKSQWSELPIPARQEMAVAAYLAALTFIQEKLAGAPPGKPLDRHRFWCLYHLFSEAQWERALRFRDEYEKCKEAERIARAVEEALGHSPQPPVSVTFLEELVKTWGRAWLVCIGQLPTKWATQ
jgi:transcriptional regulator with XRE-family HTH domain